MFLDVYGIQKKSVVSVLSVVEKIKNEEWLAVRELIISFAEPVAYSLLLYALRWSNVA